MLSSVRQSNAKHSWLTEEGCKNALGSQTGCLQLRTALLVCTDTAGATHAFLAEETNHHTLLHI